MSRKTKPKIPRNRLPFLEGIRGLAALYVVIGHLCNLADPRLTAGFISHSPLWLQRTMSCFGYGHLAVAAFIVISGFCLELSLFARESGVLHSIRVFYKRRAQRILPPYYACLAVSILVAMQITEHQHGLPFTQYVPVDQGAVLSHVFLIHNFSLDWIYKINGVLWSIAIEVQLYVLFPLLVLFLNRLGRFVTLLIVGLLAYGAIAFVPQAPKMYFWYLPLFVGGMVSAHLAFKPGTLGRLPVVGSLLFLATVAGCIYFCSAKSPIYASDLCMGFAIACLCYALTGAPRGPLYWALTWRPIVGLGAFSYSLYLMHHPIAQILYAHRPIWAADEVSLFWYLIACLPIILIGCAMFYFVFERPFIPKRRSGNAGQAKDHTPAGLPLRAYQGGNTGGGQGTNV